jgi:hypothetical protein
VDLEDLEKEYEKKQAKKTENRAVGPARLPGIVVPEDSIEAWELYMQYGRVPQDYFGF